jgi:hypothetical protein
MERRFDLMAIDWQHLESITSSEFVTDIRECVDRNEKRGPEYKVALDVVFLESFVEVYVVPKRYMRNHVSIQNSYLYTWYHDTSSYDRNSFTPHSIETFSKLMGFTQVPVEG